MMMSAMRRGVENGGSAITCRGARIKILVGLKSAVVCTQIVAVAVRNLVQKSGKGQILKETHVKN